jgi:hypothetical protein
MREGQGSEADSSLQDQSLRAWSITSGRDNRAIGHEKSMRAGCLVPAALVRTDASPDQFSSRHRLLDYLIQLKFFRSRIDSKQ